jgi:hypothetical protein
MANSPCGTTAERIWHGHGVLTLRINVNELHVVWVMVWQMAWVAEVSA